MTATLGYICALCASGCWAENSVAYALAGRRVGSQTVTHMRLWFALPFIVLLHLGVLGTLWPLGLDPVAFAFLAASGFLGFCLTDMCIFKALVDLGARETSVVMGLTPIVSAILSWWLLDEQLAWTQSLGILVTVSGVIWVVRVEGGHRVGQRHLSTGLTAAIAGAVLQAVTMILAKRGMPAGAHPISGNMVRLLFGFVGVTAVALLRGTWRQDVRRLRADRMSLMQISTGAIVGPVLGMVLALYALSAAPVGVAMTLMQLTPIILLPADVFIFKKKLGFGAVAGTLLAVVGTSLLFLTKAAA